MLEYMEGKKLPGIVAIRGEQKNYEKGFVLYIASADSDAEFL